MYNEVWGKALEIGGEFSRSFVLKVTLQSVRLLLTVSYRNKKAQLTQREARDSLGI